MGGREPVLPQALGAESGVSRGGLLGAAGAVWSAFGPREVAKPNKPARTPASQKPFCDKGYTAFTKPSKKPCTGFLNRVSQVRKSPRAPTPKSMRCKAKPFSDDPLNRPSGWRRKGRLVCIWSARDREIARPRQLLVSKARSSTTADSPRVVDGSTPPATLVWPSTTNVAYESIR